MRRQFSTAVVLLSLALAGCGGGGGGSTPAPIGGGGSAAGNPSTGGSNGGSGTGSTTTPVKTPQTVQVNIHIPGTTGTSSVRRAQFVAANTQGVEVQVYAASDTGHTSPIGTAATNVAPGSAACGGATGPRTCTVSIAAPPGSDVFLFTTWDQPPNTGTTAFPSGAHILGTGLAGPQTITAGVANSVSVTLGGALASTQAAPYNYNVPGGVGPQSYQLEISAYDAAGDAIIGPYLDVNGNADPITVTVNETGGSGFTKVAVGTNTPATTATVTSSSDIVTVSYSGGGTTGYGVTFTANAATGQPLSPTFGPMFLTSTSPAFIPATSTLPGSLTLTSANQVANFTVSETNPYGPANIGGNCAGVVSISTPTTGPVETFSVTANSGGGSCTAFIGFNFTNYTLNISAPNSTSATVAVPGSTLAYLPEGASGVVIRNTTGATVGGIATTSAANLIALDDAGNAYVGTSPKPVPSAAPIPGSIALYTPSSTGFPPTYTKSSKTYTMSYPANLIYLSASGAGEVVAMESNASAPSSPATATVFDVWDAGKTGSPSRTFTEAAAPGGQLFFFDAVAHDGTLYLAGYVPCGTNTCIQYDAYPPGASSPSRTWLESIVPQAQQINFGPNYATVGPDGTLYVTEYGFYPGDALEGLYTYPPSGPERFTNRGVYAPQGIDLDSSGNIYVVNNNATYDTSGHETTDTAHNLQVIAPDGLTQLRGVPLTPNSYAVTTAADGTAFVSAYLNSAVTGDVGGTSVIPAGGYNATPIDGLGVDNIALYNGTTAFAPQVHARAPLSIGSGSAHAGGVSFYRLRHLVK